MNASTNANAMVDWKKPPRPWRAFARERYHNIRNYTNNLQGSNSIYTNGTDYRLLREQTRKRVHKQERERWNENGNGNGNGNENGTRIEKLLLEIRHVLMAHKSRGPRSVPLAQRTPFSKAFLWVLARVRNSACSLAHNRRVLSPSEGCIVAWKHLTKREREMRQRQRARCVTVGASESWRCTC